MQLTVWTYEGPPHVGAMRVATAMTGVHYVLHAPQGDTYADLLFTMIERRQARPPVTYTTFQARDLGKDTAELFKTTAREAYERFKPEIMLVGSSCTAELIQDDPGGIGAALGLPIPVVPLELSAYQHKENWGASETLYRLVRTCCPSAPQTGTAADARGLVGAPTPTTASPATCNILGPTALGFRHRDDVIEVKRLLARLGVTVNVTAPLGASPADLRRLPQAGFNVVLAPELADATAKYLHKTFGQPAVNAVPIGVGATRDFIRQVAELAGTPAAVVDEVMRDETLRLPWYSRSVDSNYLTGKRVFIFGDATHALAAARIATEELGFKVVGLGTYSRERAREVRAAAERLGLTALITDDHMLVEEEVQKAHPELVLGTQMERHIAKRLGLPCAVISAPVHVQDYPARFSPQMGFEGANVIFDTWVHPLMMGLEEHLLAMFKDDFEFVPGAIPSHLGGARPAVETPSLTTTAPSAPSPPAPSTTTTQDAAKGVAAEGAVVGVGAATWTAEAEVELKKIPFFVRGKARRNTERFALERGLTSITLETLYDAKAHFQS
jgi:light-independent protochlorophyllide reductase subunit B